ncbi:MAG: right-handed parallel beta-helix repeat-containing protein, partial [Calothrix sp. SM1_7_51]|nr:right-handed parallel beta-helix repeat-containing protein [Calothrix sp. SM1_7_51]
MEKNLENIRALKAIIQIFSTLILIQPTIALSQPQLPTPYFPPPNFRIIVNSNADGAIQADDKLTLREAIEVVNGRLLPEKLSNFEKNLVNSNSLNSQIEFNLPSGQTTIELEQELPSLATTGTVIDGTTQKGYNASRSATAEVFIPKPIVTITPALGKEILRGLTIIADNVQIRGLSIYSFNSTSETATLSLPPANIFIDSSRESGEKAPKNVVIENNWLGITTDEKVPEKLSAFGVYIFNSKGATIRRNRISYHEGSGIITSKNADNTLMLENLIVGNGVAGMPDAIRLEGVISNSQLKGNIICGNDGAGIYLFKPDGKVKIQDNRINFNGRRLRRAAVYLMGDSHQVINNEIRNQAGPGVAITSFSTVGGFGSAVGNVIQNNQFSDLEGLSIDLNTQQNLDVSDFQRSDGVNPPRNSPQRRKETANGAI